MKSDLECLVCLLKQALNTVQIATLDTVLQREVINRVTEIVKTANLDLSPAKISTVVYRIVSEVTGIADPYKIIKQKTNQDALQLMPILQRLIAEAKDPLDAALHIAAAGNIIDIGIGHPFDLENDIILSMTSPFTINDTESFRLELKPGKRLLYIGDNSGEIVFDRVLVEEFLKHGIAITFVVKSGPIINDATMEDAETVGMTDIVPVIETGSDDIGINFNRVSKEFCQLFDTADIVLAKGHGNFETLIGFPKNIYFLLKAKCDVVAKELGVQKDYSVFKHQSGRC